MNELKKLIVVFEAYLKDSARDKTALFLTFLFPLLFLLIFANVFTGGGYEATKIGIFLDTPDAEIVKRTLESTGAWELIPYESRSELRAALIDGKHEIGVIIEGNEIKLIYREGNPAIMGEVQNISMMVKTVLERLYNEVVEIVKVKRENYKAGRVVSTGRNFILAGVIAISILSNGMFSVISVFGAHKQFIKRLISSPVKPVTMMAGMTLTRFVISLIAAIFMLYLSHSVLAMVFDLSFAKFLVLAITSTLAMMALGVLFVSVFKTSKAASNAASIFMVIATFFAGVYFPITFLPKFLQTFASFIPVKYVAQGVRYTLGVEYMSEHAFWMMNVIFALSGIFLLVWASNVFFRPER